MCKTNGVLVSSRRLFGGLLTAILGVLWLPGCYADNMPAPEVVDVAGKLTVDASYRIDLTRDDLAFYVAPDLDMTHLTVICPGRATISFSDYVVFRVEPVGVDYNPTTDALLLANAAIPLMSLRASGRVTKATRPELAFTPPPPDQTCTCTDSGDSEYCICPGPEPEETY
jgi:hypothetical protein